MPARLRLAQFLSPEELFARYQAAKEPIERTHFQVLHLVSQRWRGEDISEAVGYGVVWIRLLVARYNRGGLQAMGDQRRHNPGQARPRLAGGARYRAGRGWWWSSGLSWACSCWRGCSRGSDAARRLPRYRDLLWRTIST